MIRTNQRLEVLKSKIYRGKKIALKSIEENHQSTYVEPHKYANVVRKYNQGSFAFVKCSIDLNPQRPIFEQFYLSFIAQIEGFIAGCKRYIGLNSCHLRGPFGEVLLTIIGLDANNMMFPLAVTVVDSKKFQQLELVFENFVLYCGRQW